MNTLLRFGAVILLLATGACSREGPSTNGDWTFVNYWAEWCRPCIKEIPELNALNARDGFRVHGVNFDGASGEALSRQIDALGVEFPTLSEDPGPRFGLERPQVLPTTLVLRPDGSLLRVLVGPQTADSLIAATRNSAATAADSGPESGNKQR
ncbi:MAG: TlpA disulfide reductase family protein [Halieaceae bacterium]|nr:TlpA disulfide reductase family protein [Halieaceae bacterium]